jgi:hypothetical protein
MSTSPINYHFGLLGNALEAAGLERGSSTQHLDQFRKRLTDDDLFNALLLLENNLGKEPRYVDVNFKGTISTQPYKRFGKTWDDVLRSYQKWKHDGQYLPATPTTPTNGDTGVPNDPTPTLATPAPNVALSVSGRLPPQLYGEPIDFRGLRHAPINEQGVVYLFGMVSRELGFYIEAIQQGFPDCEGKYLYDSKKGLWAKARIEFEFRASNFRQHGHDAEQCDFVICWENDWPDCPITVMELKREILKLPSR